MHEVAGDNGVVPPDAHSGGSPSTPMTNTSVMVFYGSIISTSGTEAAEIYGDKTLNSGSWREGDGSPVRRPISIDPRIKFFGSANDIQLRDLSAWAMALLNPSPADFTGNQFNFPSKVLAGGATVRSDCSRAYDRWRIESPELSASQVREIVRLRIQTR